MAGGRLLYFDLTKVDIVKQMFTIYLVGPDSLVLDNGFSIPRD